MSDTALPPPPPPPSAGGDGPSGNGTGAGRLWARFRGLPVWAQGLGGLVLAGIVGITALAGSPDEAPVETSAAAETSTTTVEKTTTTRTKKTTTTTTVEASPEGGTRSGSAELAATPGLEDGLPRTEPSAADLTLLDSLRVEAEPARSGYDRGLFAHWGDADHDGCDTRCEVLTSQQLPDKSWYSAWDGATEVDSSLVHIDHIVALAEAWDSGAHGWTSSRRRDFANDRANLIAVTASSNLRKSDKDAAEWFPSHAASNCLWATTVVNVKAAYDLSVDQAEKNALGNLLKGCGAAPATTTPPPTSPPPTSPPPTSPPPTNPPPTSPPPPPPPSGPGSNADGSYKNCTEARERGGAPVHRGQPGYGTHLDRDGDGVGCES